MVPVTAIHDDAIKPMLTPVCVWLSCPAFSLLWALGIGALGWFALWLALGTAARKLFNILDRDDEHMEFFLQVMGRQQGVGAGGWWW
jgi:hypothetical protein